MQTKANHPVGLPQYLSILNIFRLVTVVIVLFFFSLFSPSSYAASSWTSLGLSNMTVASVTVDPTNANVIYAGTSGNGVFKSTDAGVSWNAINNGLPDPTNLFFETLVVDPVNTNILYTASETNTLYKSTDAGASWTAVQGNLPARVFDVVVDPTNDSIVYAATYGAGCQPLFKSTDGGITWNLIPLFNGYDGCDGYKLLMDPTNHNILYIGTDNNAHVFKTTDGGINWTESTGLGNQGAVRGLAIDAANANVLYAGTESSGVYKSTDATTSWSFLSNSPGGTIGRVITADPVRADNLYSATTASIYQSTNQGNSWSSFNTGLPSNTSAHQITIPKNASNFIYAATDSGIYVYNLDTAPLVNQIPNAHLSEGATYAANGSFTDSDSASWSATVDYGDGSGVQSLSLSGMDFSLSHAYKDNGSYTVTVSVTDNQGLIGTSTVILRVNNVAPTVGTVTVSPSPAHINSPVTASATFTDPGVLDTHTAVWDWGDGNTTPATISETNGSGSVSNTHTYTSFGTYTVTLTVTDKDTGFGSSSASETVVKQITALTPTKVWVSKNILNLGTKFDFQAQVYKDSTLVATGTLDSANAGSGGFNAATLETIPFSSFSPVDFPVGSQLKVTVSVRTACTGSLLGNGTATLWYGDSAANSSFGATIGTTASTYYLLNNSLLGTTVGTARQSVNVASGAKCSAFKPFGTWTITP